GGIPLDLQGRCAWLGRRRQSTVEKHRAQPAHAPTEELPAGFGLEPALIEKGRRDHGNYRVSAASMFNRAVAAAAMPDLDSSLWRIARSSVVKSRVSTERAPILSALSTR